MDREQTKVCGRVTANPEVAPFWGKGTFGDHSPEVSEWDAKTQKMIARAALIRE
jgi:hypothetical protein